MTDPGPGHLEAATLAGFIEDRLDEELRSEAADHLSTCSRCREALTAAVLTLQEERRPRIRSTAAISVALAAGIAALFLLPAIRTSSPVSDLPQVRGDQSEGIPTFSALAPADGTEVQAESLIFRWGSAGSGARYQITISDELGDVVWSAPTRETTLRGPPTDVLLRGRVYYWYVDALLDGGRTARTPVMEFRTAS